MVQSAYQAKSQNSTQNTSISLKKPFWLFTFGHFSLYINTGAYYRKLISKGLLSKDGALENSNFLNYFIDSQLTMPISIFPLWFIAIIRCPGKPDQKKILNFHTPLRSLQARFILTLNSFDSSPFYYSAQPIMFFYFIPTLLKYFPSFNHSLQSSIANSIDLQAEYLVFEVRLYYFLKEPKNNANFHIFFSYTSFG